VPALEKAAQSPDPEVRLRAAGLLPAARLGLPAGFPAELRDVLTNYPKAGIEEKQATVAQLIKLGRKGRPVLLGLARSEPDLQTRGEIFGPVIESVQAELIRRLQPDKLDTEALNHIAEGLEFYQGIVPEDATIPLKVIQRLDALRYRQRADDIFERSYRILAVRAVGAKDSEPNNDLAWLCAVSHRRLDDGLKYIEKALAKSPNEAAFLDTKAELLFQKGEKEEALKLIEKTVERSPDFLYFQKQRERIKQGDPSVPPPELEQQ
jgi:tetratricopeptide (TPR) repeat protein